MSGRAERVQGLPRAEFFGPARVLEVDEERGRIHVMMAAADPSSDEPGAPRSAWAEPALSSPWRVGWGDTVLVAGQTIEDLYVIGVIGMLDETSPMPQNPDPTQKGPVAAESREISLRNGARAEVEVEGDSESLRVYSEEGRLLFEYDPARGRSRVDLPDGDVQFVSRRGRIDFIAARGVGFFSRESIELMSAEGVKLAAANALDKTFSVLEVGKRKIDLKSDQLEVSARRGAVEIERAEYRGGRLATTLEVVRLVAERSESVVGTAIEKAKNVYRRVEQLSQLETGRLRLLVNDLYQLKSRNAIVKADETVKIDGDKIHLG